NVSVEKLEGLEKQYLERRFAVESEMRNLRQALEQELAKIALKDSKMVIFVDDLDRCDPTQIVELLDSIKLFLDLKNLFIVLAVDREVVRRGIQVRYKEFEFSEGRSDVIGHEYLEKMVQLPVELFPLTPGQITNYLERMLVHAEHAEARALLTAIALPN